MERGHAVLPDAPLPEGTAELEQTVSRYLEQCDLAIHLLGRHYGATPEDSTESVPSLQVRLSAA
ncbi:MAG: hypothetical protein GWO24_14495, partial [Akkermansiaceae bacterium]|nr:hypothetical protein [Akkermansiaceae bacterium]